MSTSRGDQDASVGSPAQETRKLILDAALDAYSRFGFRGATTRRIAEAAGVNEVTLFRHFGSKEALLSEALHDLPRDRVEAQLPAIPANVEEELTVWCEHQLLHLRGRASMIRTCMGEIEERPELTDCAASGPRRAFTELSDYLVRAREAGIAIANFDECAAAAMLMGALFSDAMGREIMQEIFPNPPESAPRQYVTLMLRAIGADEVSRFSLSDATGAPRG